MGPNDAQTFSAPNTREKLTWKPKKKWRFGSDDCTFKIWWFWGSSRSFSGVNKNLTRLLLVVSLPFGKFGKGLLLHSKPLGWNKPPIQRVAYRHGKGAGKILLKGWESSEFIMIIGSYYHDMLMLNHYCCQMISWKSTLCAFMYTYIYIHTYI